MVNGYVALGVSLIMAVVLIVMIAKYSDWDILWYWDHKEKKQKKNKEKKK